MYPSYRGLNSLHIRHARKIGYAVRREIVSPRNRPLSCLGIPHCHFASPEERRISGDEATRQMLQEKEPSLCFTSVDDIAAMALFLCSPAASNITGASFPMDGGWTAQ